MQVKGRFGFSAEAFELVEGAGFGLVLVWADEGGGGGGVGEEFAEDGFAAEFVEAGGDYGRCVFVDLLGCHCLYVWRLMGIYMLLVL